MSIKKRVFISNILMFILPFMVFSILNAIFLLLYVGVDAFIFVGDIEEQPHIGVWTSFIVIQIFMSVVATVSWFLSRRLTNMIIKPLEILSEGVHQIRDGNLSYRIDYKNKDEFRKVCMDFNEMAEEISKLVIVRENDEESRKELIAGISHDLRTPLTSIKAYMEGLEKGIASTLESKKRYFEIVKSKIAVLEHTIEQLFVFSKMDIGEFPIYMEVLDLKETFDFFVSENIEEYAGKGLNISLKNNGFSAVKVKIDVFQFFNVLHNILGNSVKYKKDEVADVEISLELQENLDEKSLESENIVRIVLIKITDNCGGVSPEIVGKLFDIFYRADPSRKNQALGNGIGLAISKKIIERLGGEIYAENSGTPNNLGLSIIIRLKEVI